MTVAVVFPGQGSQFEGMADPWVGHPAGRGGARGGERGDGARRGRRRPRRGGARDDRVRAAGTAGLRRGRVPGAARPRGSPGVVGAAGHSLGEFSALVAAGVLPLAGALRVVVVRGEAMQRAGEARPGTMTALLGDGRRRRRGALRRGPRRTTCCSSRTGTPPCRSVISGSVPAIERAEALAAERKTRAVRLHVAGAFHSPLMEPAVQPILDELAALEFATPAFPIAENVSGTLVADPGELRALLERHVISPVRWQEDAQALAAAGAAHVPGVRPRRRAHEDGEAGRARRHARSPIGTPEAARGRGKLGAVTRHATIAGVGSSLPPRLVPNTWFEGVRRHERRVDPRPHGHRGPPLRRRRGADASDLAVEAARDALDERGRGPRAARHDRGGHDHRRHPLPRDRPCGCSGSWA